MGGLSFFFFFGVFHFSCSGSPPTGLLCGPRARIKTAVAHRPGLSCALDTPYHAATAQQRFSLFFFFFFGTKPSDRSHTTGQPRPDGSSTRPAWNQAKCLEQDDGRGGCPALGRVVPLIHGRPLIIAGGHGCAKGETGTVSWRICGLSCDAVWEHNSGEWLARGDGELTSDTSSSQVFWFCFLKLRLRPQHTNLSLLGSERRQARRGDDDVRGRRKKKTLTAGFILGKPCL